MRLVNNVSDKLHGTASANKFVSMKYISIKFRPIIDQTDFCSQNAEKVLSDYLCRLCKNVYIITDTQSFSQHYTNLSPLLDDEKHVLFDFESLFKNILVLEILSCITEQILLHKQIKPICGELIFVRLLLKLPIGCKCIFASSFRR